MSKNEKPAEAGKEFWGAVISLSDGTEKEIRVPRSKMTEAQFREHVQREKAK